MAFKLPKFDRTLALVTSAFTPTTMFHQWWDSVVRSLEQAIISLQATDVAVEEALEAAGIALDAAEDAQAAADTAQAAADAAQTAVDAIVLPPTGARTVTTSQTLLDSDYQIVADATAGTFTLELPPAATMSTPILVIKVDASVNAVDIEPGAGDTLNGAGVAVSLTTQGGQRTFSSDGTTDWWS
jgi:hypothetical protein